LWRRIWRFVGEALESCGEKSEELNGGVWTTEERRITSLEGQKSCGRKLCRGRSGELEERLIRWDRIVDMKRIHLESEE
jgi:hypothetical protein